MVLRRLRSYLVAGLVVLLPAIATYLALSWLFGLVEGLASPLTRLVLGEERHVTGLGVFLVALIVLAAGALATDVFGRRIIVSLEKLVLRLPVVRSLYGLVKGITDAVFGGKGQAFQSAALIVYPRPGAYTLAFITGRTGPLYNLFVPFAVNPAGGICLLLPPEQVAVLQLPVQNALKLLISGGVVEMSPAEQAEIAAAAAQLSAGKGNV